MANFYVPANHRHFCQCGTELLCVSEHDKCPILTTSWTCPACEFESYDAYISRLSDKHTITRRPSPESHKEN